MSDIQWDIQRTALLVMDYEPTVLSMLTHLPDPQPLLSRMAGTIADMRSSGGTIAYCRVAFTEPDYAAIPATNKAFAVAALHRLMPDGDPATDIHPLLAPHPEDIVVRKVRYSALSTTDLDAQLRGRGIDTLVLAGISTSGVVLSTLIDAADRDYRLLVLTDGVADSDATSHEVLVQRIFPRLATMIDTNEFRSQLTQER
jgi:nicotinamidase-related amidase